MTNKKDDTIDALYLKQLRNFGTMENEVIPKLTAKMKELEETGTEDNRKQAEKIKGQIKYMRQQKTNYFLENSKDLFTYFESKQEIDKNINPKKNMNHFFNLKEDHSIKQADVVQSIQTYLERNNFLESDLNQYLYNKTICETCNKGELIKVSQEGIMICNKCYSTQKFLVENDKPSYKEPPKEVSFYAYKRINHFREILSQFQAKESTDIPDETIETIQRQVKKERLTREDLSNKKMKEILKKLGYNKYYEHIPFIKDKLGIKPPVMSPKLEDTLCNLFMDIQVPYSKHCPNYRVNFLNYYYTLYKLCELLGETQYLEFYPMLKDQKKLEQDEIWKQICNDLNWEFIPTL